MRFMRSAPVPIDHMIGRSASIAAKTVMRCRSFKARAPRRAEVSRDALARVLVDGVPEADGRVVPEEAQEPRLAHVPVGHEVPHPQGRRPGGRVEEERARLGDEARRDVLVGVEHADRLPSCQSNVLE
jgi:hypothetical protein